MLDSGNSNDIRVKRNIGLSVMAQGVSFLVGVIFNLIVPKYLDETQFAYWQVFALYVSYVGVLHFGILDGILLRYSQYDLDKIDKNKVKSNFVFLIVLISVFSLIGIIISSTISNTSYGKIVIILSLCIISTNIFTYNSYLFQVTNRISKYALIVISQKFVYGLIVLLLIICGERSFEWYCMALLAGDVVACLLSVKYNSGMYLGISSTLSESLSEIWANFSSGVFLLIANWSSMLLLGSARMIVQWHWNLLTFGKVSFAFSLSNMFLAFVVAASVAIFPSLKRTDESKLSQIYIEYRNKMTLFFFIMMALYFPSCGLLEFWLPKYSDSFVYMGILLPVIVYTSKVSILTNNYLKAFRKEKKMFSINVVSVIVAVIGFCISAFIFDSVNFVLFWVVIVVMLRSVFSEIIVSRLIGSSFVKDYAKELIITIVFVSLTSLNSLILGFALYSVALIVLFSDQLLRRSTYKLSQRINESIYS